MQAKNLRVIVGVKKGFQLERLLVAAIFVSAADLAIGARACAPTPARLKRVAKPFVTVGAPICADRHLAQTGLQRSEALPGFWHRKPQLSGIEAGERRGG